ncbi:GIY-YIG nuclease family protein [Tsuneonella dongtanensis]|uniref:GIY-YIG nuclease family protein n=1 Tax=Tsuneonella dongtanensis TaxID=692370 RepID=UPI0009426609
MAFHAYLQRCSDGSYYAGHTDDIDRRMAEYMTGALGGYTAKRLPVQLVWSDNFMPRDEAFAIERTLKGWSKAKKESPIAAGGPGFLCWLGDASAEGLGSGVGAGPSTSSGRAGWRVLGEGLIRRLFIFLQAPRCANVALCPAPLPLAALALAKNEPRSVRQPAGFWCNFRVAFRPRHRDRCDKPSTRFPFSPLVPIGAPAPR